MWVRIPPEPQLTEQDMCQVIQGEKSGGHFAMMAGGICFVADNGVKLCQTRIPLPDGKVFKIRCLHDEQWEDTPELQDGECLLLDKGSRISGSVCKPVEVKETRKFLG
jgi:hypothetical protein